MDNTLCVLCACVCFVSGTGCMFYPPTPSIGSNVTFSLNEWMVQLSCAHHVSLTLRTILIRVHVV